MYLDNLTNIKKNIIIKRIFFNIFSIKFISLQPEFNDCFFKELLIYYIKPFDRKYFPVSLNNNFKGDEFFG